MEASCRANRCRRRRTTKRSRSRVHTSICGGGVRTSAFSELVTASPGKIGSVNCFSLDSRFADSETLLPFWEQRALGILFKYCRARHRRILRFVLLFLLFFLSSFVFFLTSLLFSSSIPFPASICLFRRLFINNLRYMFALQTLYEYV